MIDAYLDESGIHDDSAICVIAGYFGGRGQWRKFEEDWKALLAEFDVPIAQFHSNKLLKRKGFFADWTDSKYGKFMAAAVSTIIQYKIHPIAQGIFVHDYYLFNEEQRRFLTGAILHNGRGILVTTGNPNKPYFMPFQQLVKKVASHAPVGGKAHFFFGTDRIFSEYAALLMGQMRDNPDMPFHERLGSVVFPSAKESVHLHPADFLAYLVRHHMEGRNKDRQNWNERPDKLLNGALQRMTALDDLVCYETEHMQGLLDMVNLPIRSS
jgi:uncharacterized protein DUF3800